MLGQRMVTYDTDDIGQRWLGAFSRSMLSRGRVVIYVYFL
ncbi:hypothetical protein CASFOL_021042 [Castilleja foliolosa]|uniref:Uncharacterized protein n=1 Tax=Castilleja foliolosa TaxID=1961234 RepID=A0ABD3CVF1_9LAMI